MEKNLEENSDKGGVRVVMSGPLPPAVGGMATAIVDISNSKLSKCTDLVLFNTAKKTQENRPFWKGVFTRLSLMLDWWRKMDSKKETIAHIHTCSGLTFFLDGALLLLAKMRGVPVVLHVHGGRFAIFLDDLNPVFSVFAKFLARKADVIVVLSVEWLKILEARLPGGCFKVIHNGVSVPEKYMSHDKPVGDLPIILYIGSLSKAKGILDLLEAMRAIKGAAKLVLVGEAIDSDFQRTIEGLIEKYCLTQDVFLAGACFGERKQELLASSDVFVLPSYAEAQPIALLEAMASALPVVSTTVGAIPVVVRDKKDGFLIEPGDIEALSSSLLMLISDDVLRKDFSMSAYYRCKSNFNLDAVAKLYVDMYSEINKFSS